jgi:ABC-type branched-subunit amino acid transport system permease subunit
LLDLGYVAFYAIGAYGLALGYQYLGLGFWSMLPLAAMMAAAAGALLGSRYCACTVTIWPLSPSGSGRLFA